MKGFIYKVTNLINGKIYIGQTVQSVKDRWYRHCGKSGLSKGEMQTHFKRAILKYGKENFKVETIEEVDRNLLDEREIYWISYYNSNKIGYNSTKGGYGFQKEYKTTESQNQEIIREYLNNKSLREIGRIFKLDKTTVKGILIRHNIALRNKRIYKFSDEIIKNLLKDLKLTSRKEVKQKYNISDAHITWIVKRFS